MGHYYSFLIDSRDGEEEKEEEEEEEEGVIDATILWWWCLYVKLFFRVHL